MPPRDNDAPATDDLNLLPDEEMVTEESMEAKRPPMQIVWRNVIWFAVLHLWALYGLICVPWTKPITLLWALWMYMMNALGITAGAHRLWAHRAYRAKLPLRILLACFNLMSFQNDIIEWARDHRVHHKYSETDGDPHNAKRGFFFAHVGWLLVRKHPDVKSKGKNCDISDLYADPVCRVQRKLYLPGVLVVCILMPSLVPWYYWGEGYFTSLSVAVILRYTACLNVTWCVNSAAHMWGNKPYDKVISPTQNFMVTVTAMGEGFHNFHHTFPHDYSTSEFGWKFNMTTMFIDTFAMLGQVHSRKKISKGTVDKRKLRTGDGSTGFGYSGTPESAKED